MRANHIGYGPGMAAPEAAASLGAAGVASAVADAVAPARLTAQKESAPAAQAAQSREQIEHRNSATGSGADKALFTLRALLTLKGHALDRIHGDDEPVCFYVTRRGMASVRLDLGAVARFLDQVGDAHA